VLVLLFTFGLYQPINIESISYGKVTEMWSMSLCFSHTPATASL